MLECVQGGASLSKLSISNRVSGKTIQYSSLVQLLISLSRLLNHQTPTPPQVSDELLKHTFNQFYCCLEQSDIVNRPLYRL